jgi:ligand-binding sensor domain-containing protein
MPKAIYGSEPVWAVSTACATAGSKRSGSGTAWPAISFLLLVCWLTDQPTCGLAPTAADSACIATDAFIATALARVCRTTSSAACGWERLERGSFACVTNRWPSTRREGMPSDLIWSIREDDRGAVWVATAGGGLIRLEGDTVTSLGTKDGLSSDLIWPVFPDGRGSVWFGAEGGILQRYRDDRVETVFRPKRDPPAIGRALWVTRSGEVWFAVAEAGISRFGDGRSDRYTVDHRLPDNNVRAVVEDREGVVWAATSAGLGRFRGAGFEQVSLGAETLGEIRGMVEDSDGGLWLATLGRGLLRWHKGDGMNEPRSRR